MLHMMTHSRTHINPRTLCSNKKGLCAQSTFKYSCVFMQYRIYRGLVMAMIAIFLAMYIPSALLILVQSLGLDTVTYQLA